MGLIVPFLFSGEAAVDEEKSKATGAAIRAKKRLTKLKSSQKVAWGKLLSQCSQVGFMFNSILTSCCFDLILEEKKK